MLVVTLGRLGDMYGRVRIYNAGFAVFTAASVALALTPMSGGAGALWLIGFRVLQGVGGAMIMANSTAVITDTFPARQRGTAFLPRLLTGPFHRGLTVVFILATGLALPGAVVSLFRGGVYIHDEQQKSGVDGRAT